MLLHIPHSSTRLPPSLTGIVPDSDINRHTDWFTDELFVSGEQFIFSYSRFYCDVERLENDPLEAVGRGIAYTKLDDGTLYRDGLDDTVKSIYTDWHRNLRRAAEKHSSLLRSVVVVDCHSFSTEQINIAESDLPDICLGWNESNTPPVRFLSAIENLFSKSGYSVAHNFPYSGAIVASKLDNVYSLMIEINKRTYLNPDFSKNEGFEKLSDTIASVLTLISNFEASKSDY